MDALGRLFDIGTAFAPVDTQTAAITGKRISLQNATGCTIVVVKAVGAGTDKPVFTLKQHTAASAGTSADLAAISYYYVKKEAVLDNDESWTKVAQTLAATVTTPDADAQLQAIYAFEVDAADLASGYTHISLDVADTGAAGAQLGAAIYLLHDLAVQRTPANLGNLLNPGAANA